MKSEQTEIPQRKIYPVKKDKQPAKKQAELDLQAKLAALKNKFN